MFFCIHFSTRNFENLARAKSMIARISKFIPPAYNNRPTTVELPDRQTFVVKFARVDEGEDEQIHFTPQTIHCLEGYISRTVLEMTQGRAMAEYQCNGPTDTHKVGGVAAFLSHTAAGGTKLWCTETQTVGLYFANGSSLSVAGTRPLLTHLLAIESDNPQIEVDNIDVRITSNSWLNHTTPFRGTKRLRPYHSLQLSSGQFMQVEIKRRSGEFALDDLTKAVPSLAMALKDAIPKRDDLSVLLSGGKDSRTVASAVMANGLDYRGITYGHPAAQEPIIAARLAKESRAIAFETRSQPAVRDLIQAATRSCMRTEGLITAVAHQISFDAPEFLSGRILHGHGHILRGGHGLPPIGATAAEVVKKTSYAYTSGWIKEEYHRKSLAFLAEWSEKYMENHRALPFLAHAELRVGVHLAPGILEYAGVNGMIYPLCDHNVVALARQFNLNLTADETAVFGAIRMLAPELTNFPLYGEMWQFEKDKELPIYPGRSARDVSYDKNHTIQSKSGLRWLGTNHRIPNEKTAAQYILDSSCRSLLEPMFSERFQSVIDNYALNGTLNDREKQSSLPVQGSVKRKLYETFSLCVLYDLQWMAPYRPAIHHRLIDVALMDEAY